MTTRTPLRLFLATALICTLHLPGHAKTTDEAERAFNDAFAKDTRLVRQTKGYEDDIQLASRFIQEAQSGQHSPALSIRLYEKAYELAMRDPAGYSVANAAIDRLIEKEDEHEVDTGNLRLMLLEKWARNQPEVQGLDPEAFIDRSMRKSLEAVAEGNSNEILSFLNRVNRLAMRIDSPRKHDVGDTITELVRTRRALEEIAALEEALATDPSAADKLAMLYLANLDNPEKAVSYAAEMTDKALADQVRLASVEFELASADTARQVGAFYFGLVTEGKTREPIAMLIRARVWLTEYLARQQDDEAANKAVNEMLGEIDGELLKRGIGRKLMRKLSSRVRGDGQFDRPEDVQAAIDKGVEWLYKQHNERTHWDKDQAGHRHWGGYTALVTYALLMADEEPRLNADLSRAIHFMMNVNMYGTYAICFRIHAWEVLPRRERYRQVLTRDISRLRSGSTRHGFWGYTLTGKDVNPKTRLDMSTTLAGGLGLWIGEEVGGVTAKKAYWERIAKGIIEHQLDDNGWCYNPATGQQSQGAMTAGALALLHASYPHLGSVTKERADEAIERGMKWMDENFDPTRHVNRGGFKCYYFAAVQHAGIFAGRRDFKEMDWYKSIAEHLVKTQTPDGAWGSVEETAFAIAFLCRGGIVYEPSDSVKDAPSGEDNLFADQPSVEDLPSDQSAE